MYTKAFNMTEEDINEILDEPLYSNNNVEEVMNEKIAGKTIGERFTLLKGVTAASVLLGIKKDVSKTFEEADKILKDRVESIGTNIETINITKGHRVVEQGKRDKVLDVITKKNNFKATKEWNSQDDSLVRQAHNILHKNTIGVDDNFYSPAGGVGYGPGLMGNSGDDIRCRCYLVYNYQKGDN